MSSPSRAVIGAGLAALLVAAVQPASGQQRALPSTQDFMNIMTVCGGGSAFRFEGDLRRDAESLYEKGRTEGKALQDIIASITAQLPEKDRLDGYRIYSDCVGRMIGPGK